MQFSEAWLRSLVNPALDTQALGHLLTMAGLEVEDTLPAAAPFTHVVVAQILSAQKHPDADRLQVCQVDVGEAAPLTIVCGAPNARAGLKTACARVGAELPGAFHIRQAKVRGVESFGMLCSAKELGMPGDASGILELDADAPVGTALRDWLQLDDTLITLKLTPNRGDCLSLSGLAREVAALTAQPMQAVDCTPVPASLTDTQPLDIQAASACPVYCGRVIRGINAAARTPAWMVRRLERCGLRAIHPVVDVTNYVLLELGQPMHGFDMARLQGALQVRMAQAGESLALLNGQRIELKPDSLIIADASGPLALAGIMGGEGSGVEAGSSDIFLEAAHFTPEVIAGRARAYGLSTDSSHRFERGVDPLLPQRAMERATRLILDLCGGQAGPLQVHGGSITARAPIPFRPERARRLLGFHIDDQVMADILARLDLNVEKTAAGFLVSAPSHRFDLTREVDLIEEIVRVHGYEALPATPLHGTHHLLPSAERERSVLDVKNQLASMGYNEVITYSFISSDEDADFRAAGEAVQLVNPIASQMNTMRGSLMSGLLQALRHNLNHGQERLRLFEIGRVFLGADANVQPQRAGGLVYGSAWPEQWGSAARGTDFYDLRANLEALFYPVRPDFRTAQHPALHPGQCAAISLNGADIGWMGALHPALTQKYGLSKSPLLFEVDLAALTARNMPRHGGISRLPAVRRDIAVVVDENVRAGDMLACVRAAPPAQVSEIALFDVYQGQGVESGKKSLAFKVLVQHTEKTLTDTEIDAAVQEVLQLFNQEFQAILRN